MMPPVADLLAGFIPSVPDPVAGDNSTPFLIISGMVGTTVAPAMFLMRTTLVKVMVGVWTICLIKIVMPLSVQE
ncbi:hypothetical protein WBU86_13415 [Escherichia coli]